MHWLHGGGLGMRGPAARVRLPTSGRPRPAAHVRPEVGSRTWAAEAMAALPAPCPHNGHISMPPTGTGLTTCGLCSPATIWHTNKHTSQCANTTSHGFLAYPDLCG